MPSNDGTLRYTGDNALTHVTMLNTVVASSHTKHETRNTKHETCPHIYVVMRPSALPPSAPPHSFAAHVNTEICSPFYQVLVRRDDAEQREAFQRILRGLLQVNRLLV